MKLIRKLFSPFVRDSRGVSTVEYALILVAVVAIVGAGMVFVGGQFKGLFTTLSTEISGAKTDIDGINVTPT